MSSASSADPEQRLRLHVHGMDCAEEAVLVRRALADDRGIRHIEFDLVHGIVDITFAPQATSEAGILTAVRGTGLPVHAVHGEAGHQAVAAEHAGHLHDHEHHSAAAMRATVASGLLFAAGWIAEGFNGDHWSDLFLHHDHDPRATVLYALSAAAGLWPMWRRAIASVRYLRLDMHALVCLTVIGAGAIGEWSEGAAVAFLFAFSHRIEAWSIERARAEVAALIGRGPSLVAGHNAPAPFEGWIERFAAVYTPAVTGAAVIVALAPPLFDGDWATWFYRALVFLVLACPCALVISTPVTMVAALTAAARAGMLVKGGDVLERAAEVSAPTPAGLAASGVTIAGARDTRAERVAAADVVLTATDDRAVALLVRHAQRAMRVVRQNVAISLLTKVAFLVTAPFGLAPLWMAVLADTGATAIVTLNGLRLLRMRQ